MYTTFYLACLLFVQSSLVSCASPPKTLHKPITASINSISMEVTQKEVANLTLNTSLLFDWSRIVDESFCLPLVIASSGSHSFLFETSEVHNAVCRFLSVCNISYRANPKPDFANLPHVSPMARQYFTSRCFQLWDTNILTHEAKYRTWSEHFRGEIGDFDENRLDKLITDFNAFNTLFPQDHYLGAYANLCSAILKMHKRQHTPNLAKQFVDIENKYPDLPEIGIMSSWCNAMSLASTEPVKAKEAFKHLATRYKNHDWRVVHVATEASKGSTEKWVEMGLIAKQYR